MGGANSFCAAAPGCAFDSTQIATVFLDRDLTIRSFTPTVSTIYNIRPADRGRPITDLATRIPMPQFADEVRQVFASGEMLEAAVIAVPHDVLGEDVAAYVVLRTDAAPFKVLSDGPGGASGGHKR